MSTLFSLSSCLTVGSKANLHNYLTKTIWCNYTVKGGSEQSSFMIICVANWLIPVNDKVAQFHINTDVMAVSHPKFYLPRTLYLCTAARISDYPLSVI